MEMTQEQLFTDLTSKDAAIIEGGAYRLLTIECLRATDGFGDADEPYINAGGKKVWSGSMQKGSTAKINKTISGNRVSLYDADPWPNDDDLIGSGILEKGDRTELLGGSRGNPSYRLRYTIV
jgi:hypothetical protein